MPARAARCAVEATVVAPVPAAGRDHGEVAHADLDHAVVAGHDGQRLVVEPDAHRPATTAMVAGTAPPSRTACSISRATRRLSGRGRPWLMIVDSRATTGGPRRAPSATSSDSGSSGSSYAPQPNQRPG